MWIKSILAPVRLERGVWAGGVGLIIAGFSAMLTDQGALGWIGVGIGLTLFVWGTTVHGLHLWEPWWRGPIRPYVNAALLDFPYEQGSIIKGMKWDPDFSHVHVHLSNPSKEILLDLNFVVFLDRHIIRSTCQSQFAECKIAPVAGPVGQVTIVGIDEDGNRIAFTGDESNAIDIAPSHRLICAKLPSGAALDINLATVLPLQPPKPKFWTKSDPTRINLEGTYSVRGITQHVGWYQPLGKAAI